MKKQNQFKLIWLIPVVIIAATVVTVVIFGLSSKGVSGTPGYKVVFPITPTLSVSLTTDPSSGPAPLNDVDLTADVSGTATGTINYKFDCTDDGIWDHIFNNISDNPKTVTDACDYSLAGDYTARVYVERDTAPSATDTATITVTNAPPTVECNEDEVWNYCKDSLNPELSWNYEDEEGDPQEYYWIQIDDDSDFLSPIINTGWVPTPPPFPACTYRPTDEILAFDTPHYYWQVKVKDSAGRESDYCLEGRSFTTPKHAYPKVAGPYEFTWSPDPPIALEPVEFFDNTKFDDDSTGQSWFWDFSDDPDADPSWSDLQNPTATPSVQGDWNVTLRAMDDVGSCLKTININVAKPLPEWEEVKP